MIEYECPRCYRSAPWTDGRTTDAGDPFDEFWCQTCGEETPLADMRQILTIDLDPLPAPTEGTQQ